MLIFYQSIKNSLKIPHSHICIFFLKCSCDYWQFSMEPQEPGLASHILATSSVHLLWRGPGQSGGAPAITHWLLFGHVELEARACRSAVTSLETGGSPNGERVPRHCLKRRSRRRTKALPLPLKLLAAIFTSLHPWYFQSDTFCLVFHFVYFNNFYSGALGKTVYSKCCI